MGDVPNTSIKQEILDKSIVGSSRKPIELDDDEESSDGENSVIILDSDTEAENADVGDEEEDEDGNGEEDLEEESEDEDEEESEEDSDSSVDSESVDSVWSDVGEANGDKITTEAAEVQIVKKFEKAMILIADNKPEHGKRTLEKLLEDPIIAQYKMEDTDYELLEEPPMLARMLQIFIAAHKNLAKLNPDEEVSHLCQVLAYEPNNSIIWLDVAMKSVENGDLNFAKYAFKKCESLNESLEAHATVLYISCEYSACLKILKMFKEETDGLNDKMKYLKYKIRSTNQYYKQLSDRVFEEDEVYAVDNNVLDQRKILVFDERIGDLMKKVEEKRKIREAEFEKGEERLSPIHVKIFADQDLPTVCTVFCDLFDRIHAYSNPHYQLIKIIEWESRQDHLDVRKTVSSIVDIVECIEELTQQVEEDVESKKKRKGKKRRNKEEKKEYLATWRKRLFMDRASEDVESEQNTTADEDGGEDDESQDEFVEVSKNTEMPEIELAATFGLTFGSIEPIKTKGRGREKTPPPSDPRDFIDCDGILAQLESKFSSGSHTIIEILEFSLFTISAHTPARGALPESMREVTREMYNRIAFSSLLMHRKYHELNVTVMELDCRKATEICIRKYISFFHRPQDEEYQGTSDQENGEIVTDHPSIDRLLRLRFMWKYANSGLKDDIKLSYLYALEECLRCEEVVATSSGSFATWDVSLAIEELEKKSRIESVKQLWNSRVYTDLIKIIENDIEFGDISNEETLEMLGYWMEALEKLEKHKALALLSARTLHFYLFTKYETGTSEQLEKLVQRLLDKLQKKEFSFKKVDKKVVVSLGYLICLAMKKYKEIEKNWKNWIILYNICKVRRGASAEEYIETLDSSTDPHAMPLLELDLLVKAHEVLGEEKCCSQDEYKFLFFVVDRFRELIEDIPTLELIYDKDNGWLWDNLNLEISQILFCMYGKYGRKRKAAEDHENGGQCAANLESARRVIPIILVQPLPLYDEKEKLSHDVVDLLNSKFSFLLKMSPSKKLNVAELTRILRESNTLEDVNGALKKCRFEEEEEDGYVQSLVWYAMALSAYRTSSHKEALKYSELYLLTEDSEYDDRLRASVWGILAHQNVLELFQLDPHEIHEQWKWRIMPFRMAVDAQEHEPVPHFQLATTLYQLASSLARFYRYLPETDARKPAADDTEISALRFESRDQFDRCLELTKLGDDGSQPEHQWLCYFFIGKLESKSAKCDVVKVVESFYEAACGCELAGFYYPQKVQTKKQTNFEPIEVHYQVFSAVYKYLIRRKEYPSLEVLRKLRVLLKVMQDGHKVAKPNSSLFKFNLEICSIVDSLVCDTVQNEKKRNNEVHSMETQKEAVDELKKFCFNAFTLITDRFPHIKAYYRLAQIAMEQSNSIDTASEHIFKNVFKRKKRDDGMFENVVEISCNDISRYGSHQFHISRCLQLGVQIAQRLQDLHNVVAILVAMVNAVTKEDDDHVAKELWNPIITITLEAMEQIVKSKDMNARNTPSPAPGELPQPQPTNSSKLSTTTIRNELWRLHKAFSKSSKPDDELIKRIKSKTEELITFVFKSVEALRSKMTSMNGDGSMRKKYNVQKRKLDSLTDASHQPLLKRIAEQFSVASATKMTMATDGVTSSTSSTAVLPPAPKLAGSGSATKQPTLSALSSSSSFPYLPLSDSDDDVQCIDPAPPAKKAAPSILQKPAATKPTPPGQQKIPIQNTPTSLTTVVQKPGTSSAKVLKPATTSFTVQKPASLPSTVQKPTTSTSNAPQKPAALYSKVQKPPTSSAAQPNVAMALLTGMASTDPSTRLYATQALQTLQAAHAAHAAKSAQEAQVAKMVQALQAEQAAAKEAKRLKAAQARAVQQVQAVQAQFMAQLVSAATATAPVVRPTPARPNPAPKPRPKPQQQPQQQQQQPQPQQRPSLVGKPPTSSPVRPTPVRPNAPSTSSNNNMTAASTAQQRFETLQFLNSIPDPAMKERLIQQLFGNNK